MVPLIIDVRLDVNILFAFIVSLQSTKKNIANQITNIPTMYHDKTRGIFNKFLSKNLNNKHFLDFGNLSAFLNENS